MRTALLLAGVALPFVVSPGASFTITVTSAATGDRLSPVKVWAGTALGITVLALVAGLTGVGGLVAGSAPAQLAFGVVGGGVLAAFGVSALRTSLQPERPGRPGRPGHTSASAGPAPLVLWAFLALVTNVKALSLYALVVPTVQADVHGLGLYLGFGAVHVAMLLVWLVLVGLAVMLVPGMRSERARRGLGALGGASMIGLGGLTLATAVW